jgi:hypothetical protein
MTDPHPSGAITIDDDVTIEQLLDLLIESSYLQGRSGKRIVSTRCVSLRQQILALAEKLSARRNGVTISVEDAKAIMPKIHSMAGVRERLGQAIEDHAAESVHGAGL